jgi:hypothetical protein
MKIRLQFGLIEPHRDINWYQTITDFPHFVLYKGDKWQFEMYGSDPFQNIDYVCYFSPVRKDNPLYTSQAYENIDQLINPGWGTKCECGAIYTSAPQIHMFFCPLWKKY